MQVKNPGARTLLFAIAVTCLFVTRASVFGSTWAQEGFDPDARAFLERLLSAYVFYPQDFNSLNWPGRFWVMPVRAAQAEANKQRAVKLFERLKAGDYRLIGPIERGDALSDLKTYLAMKPECAHHPYRFRNSRNGRDIGVVDFDLYSKASAFVPYVPGKPRPIDYEIFDVTREVPQLATANLAFYRLPVSRAATADEQFYVLRAEEFRKETDTEPGGSDLPSTMAAFEYPSCVFRGSIDFRKWYWLLDIEKKKVGDLEYDIPDYKEIRDEYLAEIVAIDKQYYALIISPQNLDPRPQFELRLWDLGVGSEEDGNWYLLTTYRRR